MIKKLLILTFRIIKSSYLKIYSQINHNGYINRIGVNFGNNLNVYGSPYAMFGTEPWIITLGDNVHITRGCLFVTHDGGTLLFRDQVPDLELTFPIIVGSNVYIGVRSIILPGVKIGNNCIIGAGSIVTKDVESNSVVAGIPAKYIKSYEEYFEKAKLRNLHLGHLKYKEKDNALKKFYNYTK